MASVLKPLLELFEIARDRVLLTLPNETYQSYPILARGPEPASPGRVIFLYGSLRSVRNEGRYFRSPSVRATFDVGGNLVSRDSVTPAELGGPHAPGDVIGLHVLAPGLSPEEYERKRARLFALYDRLGERFLEGDGTRSGGGQALEFRELFFSLSEKPLSPYYRAVGKSFFAWVDALSGPS